MRVQLNGSILFATAVIAALILAERPARADYSLTITSTGSVSNLSDPNNLFGAGTALSSGTYTLSLYYGDVGGTGTISASQGNYMAFIDGSESVSATLTVNGFTIAVPFLGTSNVDLLEQTGAISNSMTGMDSSGNLIQVLQGLNTASPFTADPDLQRSLAYTLVDGDTGTDSIVFTGPGDAGTINLTGVPTSISMTVPEPASLLLTASALAGLGLVGRRRRAAL